jgi:membrane-associated phospholipid phosphatase
VTLTRRWWLPAGLAAAAALLVLRRQPLNLDRWSLDLMLAHRTGITTPLALAVAFLGGGALLYPLLLLLAIILPGRRAAALLSVAALATAQLLHDILLAGVALPRPDPALHLTTAAGAATASGHAMTAVVGWGLLLTLLRTPRRIALLGALTAGLLVGLARAYLAVHWLSDALAGLLLGLVLLLVSLTLLDRPLPPIPWPRLDRRWLLPLAAALAALLPIVFTPAPSRMKDLLVYAGSAAAAGSGTDVYAYRTPFGMPFTYPPFAAVLVEPLSRIPLGLLQILWALGTVALLVPLARVAMAPVVARIGLPVTLTLLLISAPVRSHLRFGQIGILLVLLVALDLLRTTRPALTGWGAGLAAAVKLTPAVYLPWMFATNGLRTRGIRTLLWAGGATLLGLLLLWPSSPAYLLDAAWDSTRFGDNAIPGNQSLRGALLRSGLPAAWVPMIWALAALVLLVIATYNARRLELAGNRLGAIGVLAALSVAVSPISWVHHLVWLVLPIAALVDAGRVRWALGWYALLAVGLPNFGTLADARVPALHPLWMIVIDLQGLTAVACAVFLPLLLVPRVGSRGRALGVQMRVGGLG